MTNDQSNPNVKKSGQKFWPLGLGHLDFPNSKFQIPNSAGITLIEIIVALAVVLTACVGLLRLASFQTKATTLASQETRAYFLADEALEATRIVRDGGWSSVTSLLNGTRYYPVVQSGTWTLSNSNPGAINGYTRFITLYQVFRDANGNIASSGTADANTRRVQAQIQWTPEGGGTQTISLETYITNWQKR